MLAALVAHYKMSLIGPFTTGCLFRGRPTVTEHCGHGWTCSLPRPVAIDPKASAPGKLAKDRRWKSFTG